MVERWEGKQDYNGQVTVSRRRGLAAGYEQAGLSLEKNIGGEMAMFVLRNCTFVEALTEGTELKAADILIKDGRIERIEPRGTAFEREFEEMDVHGATVLPGLIDMHVHLYYTRAIQAEARFVEPANRVFDCLRYAQHLLNIGVTTVRDAGDDEFRPVTAVRNAISQGIVTGPRIIESGMILCPTEIGTEVFDNISLYVDSPMEMRKAVRLNFQKGAQFIKLYGSGSMMSHGSEPGMRIMEADEILEAVKIAASKNSYCAIHAHGADAIDVAVHCGVRTVEHASFIGDKTLQFMDGRTDVGIVPTLAVLKELTENTDSSTDYGSFVVEKTRRLMNDIAKALKNAYRYNILIGWGTDVPLAAYQKFPGEEFRMRKEFLDFANVDILKQATINSARLIMKDDQIGSIKVGKCADLIVVEGDPVQDISVMYTPPAHVFKDGKLIR
jgi:imidazolonepropionase-like amidohydrolase